MFDFDPMFTLKLLLGAALSAFIGLERQLRGKPVGIRTSMIICIGTIGFSEISQLVQGDNIDATRVLGQIVTGIGFLGAGVILSRKGFVRGMTSAAVIWTLAALGATIGFGHFGHAIQITAFVLFALVGVRKLEMIFIHLKQGQEIDE